MVQIFSLGLISHTCLRSIFCRVWDRLTKILKTINIERFMLFIFKRKQISECYFKQEWCSKYILKNIKITLNAEKLVRGSVPYNKFLFYKGKEAAMITSLENVKGRTGNLDTEQNSLIVNGRRSSYWLDYCILYECMWSSPLITQQIDMLSMYYK